MVDTRPIDYAQAQAEYERSQAEQNRVDMAQDTVAQQAQAERDAGALEEGKLPEWKDYLPPDQREARKDIILTRLIEAGAPAEVIAAYIERNPEVAESAGTGKLISGVSEALRTGEADITTGAGETTIRSSRPSETSIEAYQQTPKWRPTDETFIQALTDPKVMKSLTDVGYKREDIEEYARSLEAPRLLAEEQAVMGADWTSTVPGLAPFAQYRDPETGGYNVSQALIDGAVTEEQIRVAFGAGAVVQAIGARRDYEYWKTRQDYADRQWASLQSYSADGQFS